MMLFIAILMRAYVMFQWILSNGSVYKLREFISNNVSDSQPGLLDTVFVGGLGLSICDFSGSIIANTLITKIMDPFVFEVVAAPVCIILIVVRLFNMVLGHLWVHLLTSYGFFLVCACIFNTFFSCAAEMVPGHLRLVTLEVA